MTIESVKKPSINPLAFILAGLSFIPLFGVLLGIVCIVWGVISKRKYSKIVALVGLAGVLFTVLLYGGLFYFGFVQRGGIYDELRGKMTKTNLNQLAKEIDLYKLNQGEYPKSLSELKKHIIETEGKGSMALVYFTDPTITSMSTGSGFFNYELGSNNRDYKFFSNGADGKPHTSDDVYPSIKSR
jgi:hypothetical protein